MTVLAGPFSCRAAVRALSRASDADRALFRYALGLKWVDAGHGWLVIARPPGEAAFHPSDEKRAHSGLIDYRIPGNREATSERRRKTSFRSYIT